MSNAPRDSDRIRISPFVRKGEVVRMDTTRFPAGLAVHERGVTYLFHDEADALDFLIHPERWKQTAGD